MVRKLQSLFLFARPRVDANADTSPSALASHSTQLFKLGLPWVDHCCSGCLRAFGNNVSSLPAARSILLESLVPAGDCAGRDNPKPNENQIEQDAKRTATGIVPRLRNWIVGSVSRVAEDQTSKKHKDAEEGVQKDVSLVSPHQAPDKKREFELANPRFFSEEANKRKKTMADAVAWRTAELDRSSPSVSPAEIHTLHDGLNVDSSSSGDKDKDERDQSKPTENQIEASFAASGEQEDEPDEFMEEVVKPWIQSCHDHSRQELASLEARRAQPGEQGWTSYDEWLLDMTRKEVEMIDGVPEAPGSNGDEAERAEAPHADRGSPPSDRESEAERAESPPADRGHGAEPPESPGDRDDETREFMEQVVLPLHQRVDETVRRTLASLEARRAQPGERGWTHWDQHALDMVRRVWMGRI